nr:hypothetical protein [Mycolicibacterium sp. CBMA 213]
MTSPLAVQYFPRRRLGEWPADEGSRRGRSPARTSATLPPMNTENNPYWHGGRPPKPRVDPRLLAAVEGAAEETRRAKQRQEEREAEELEQRERDHRPRR